MFEAGIFRVFIDLRVTFAQMKEWEPARIEAFFNGIAMAQRAAGDEPRIGPDTTRISHE